MKSFDIVELDYYKVGQNIRRFRIQSKLTQDGLSERAGVSKQYLSLLEKGKKKGRLEIYYHIALALNITMDTLIGNQAPLDSAISHSDIVEKISNYSQKQYEQLIDYMGYIDYAADKEGK